MRVEVRSELELSFLDRGPRDGAVVMLIPGLGGRKEGWGRVTTRLSRRHRVIAVDPRGMGESTVVSGPCRVEDLAEDLRLLLDALEVEQVHATGVSMGGKVALSLALQWPRRVRSLVLLSTSPGGAHHVGESSYEWLRDGAQAHEIYAERVVPRLFGPTFRKERLHMVTAFARARHRSPPDPRGLAAQWEAHDHFDAWEALPSVSQPTLVLTGDEDDVVEPRNSELLVQRIPRARLVVLEGVGHSPQVEAPERVVEEARRFWYESS